MNKHFTDYVWKGGIPRGIGPATATTAASSESYKIVMDPYRKRISLEKYLAEKFVKIIYDSALFDFRHLRSPEHAEWQKTVTHENEDTVECIVRNHDDRIIFIEHHRFKSGLCCECLVKSPHGIIISRHEMQYTKLGDPVNGVILFDANERQVMSKRYEADEVTGEFTTLILEDWNATR